MLSFLEGQEISAQEKYIRHSFTDIDNQIKCDFNIFSIARTEKNNSNFYSKLKSTIINSVDYDLDKNKIVDFLEKIKIINIPKHTITDYQPLKNVLDKTSDFQTIFYFSTPSAAFGDISETLEKCNLINSRSKVVLEKPLGFKLQILLRKSIQK